MQTKIIEMYKSGLPVKDIASRIGKSNSWIYTVLGRNGIHGPKKRSKLTAEDKAAIDAMYAKGVSMRDISKAVGRRYSRNPF